MKLHSTMLHGLEHRHFYLVSMIVVADYVGRNSWGYL